MSRRLESILELFQEQLEVEGYDADDIETAHHVYMLDGGLPTLADLPAFLAEFLAMVIEVGEGRDLT